MAGQKDYRKRAIIRLSMAVGSKAKPTPDIPLSQIKPTHIQRGNLTILNRAIHKWFVPLAQNQNENQIGTFRQALLMFYVLCVERSPSHFVELFPVIAQMLRNAWVDKQDFQENETALAIERQTDELAEQNRLAREQNDVTRELLKQFLTRPPAQVTPYALPMPDYSNDDTRPSLAYLNEEDTVEALVGTKARDNFTAGVSSLFEDDDNLWSD